jgi:hypothetical protein
MRLHHTKNKGDPGVLYAKVDLAEKGYRLLLPLSEHEPFDLVAYQRERFLRVSVKYRSASNGVIVVKLVSIWADRRGNHFVPLDKRSVDLVCIYCPDTRCCYYIDPTTVEKTIQLRLVPPRNNQKKDVSWAKDFTEIPERLREDEEET